MKRLPASPWSPIETNPLSTWKEAQNTTPLLGVERNLQVCFLKEE
jgi:hypothetical protein